MFGGTLGKRPESVVSGLDVRGLIPSLRKFPASGGEVPIERQRATSVHQQDQDERNRQQVVLEAFAGVASGPVHEEPDVESVGQRRHNHHDQYAGRGNSRQQAEQQTEPSEDFRDHRHRRQDRRNAHRLLEQAAASGAVKAFVQEQYARKARLPGFGHRIYKVPDPRVPPLRAAIRAMGNVRLLKVAEELDQFAAPLYGPKGVHANIDLFSAVLLDALGVAPPQYVAAFALGVACGWLAHWIEQQATGRLVRPDSEYIGPALRPLPHPYDRQGNQG